MQGVTMTEKNRTLYDPSFEHDACGIGAVVNIDGTATHKIVDNALCIVEKLEHRAGKDATGETGDGVGILVQISHRFFKQAAKQEVIVPILVEVNIAEEKSKFGIHKEEAFELVKSIALLPHLRIQGLMTIAPFVEDPEDNRLYFRQIHQLSVDIKEQNIDNVRMDVLSMGMTGDYTVAIEEGATMVRVGTGIFGERNYNI